MYQSYCNDCGWYGHTEGTGESARYDALEHGHGDVEVHEPKPGGAFFVAWRSTDGRGEDGEIHIN